MHITINKISTFTYFHLIQLLTNKAYLTVFILTETEVECPDASIPTPHTVGQFNMHPNLLN